MKRENAFNQRERKKYNNEHGIFNNNPLTTKDYFKNNYNFINDYNIDKMIINANKKDSVRECLRSRTPDTFTDNYKKYITINSLKKRSQQIQKLESYGYNYNELNNNYKKICYRSKMSNIQPGIYKPSDFSSEYTRMQDYVQKKMNKKYFVNNEESYLNKSQDFPSKFTHKRKNYLGKVNGIKDLYMKNTSNINKTNNNKYNYFTSNIFFDKNKEKSNQQLLNNLREVKIKNNFIKKLQQKM